MIDSQGVSSMDDTRIPFSIECPKSGCNAIPIVKYTERQWRWFVDNGKKIPFHCIMCDGHYEHELTNEQKTKLLKRLDEQISK